MQDFNFYSIAETLAKARYANDEIRVQDSIVKCLLHDCIFQSLHNHNLFAPIVFQGGTALQRIYKLPRFSEDLDFVCPQPDEGFFANFNQKFRIAIMETLTQYGIGANRIYIKSPDSTNLSKEILKVKKWEMRIDLTGEGKRRDFVRIEIAHIPAEDVTQKLLEPFAPQYMQCPPVLLNVESEKEIMADKVIALCCRPYIKYRDVFDLHYLKDRGVQYELTMVLKKFDAYHVDKIKIIDGLEAKKKSLLYSGLQQYHQEMGRFLHGGWAKKEYEPWHQKAIANAVNELQAWQENILV